MGSAITWETAGGNGVGPAVIRYCLTYGLAIALDPTQQPEAEPLAPVADRQHFDLVATDVEPALRHDHRVPLAARASEEEAARRGRDESVDGDRERTALAAAAAAGVAGHQGR